MPALFFPPSGPAAGSCNGPHHKRKFLAVVSTFCLLSGFVGALSAAAPVPVPPDLTQGGKKDDSHDWQLGPTGARGWIHTAMGHSAASRQILVTVVDAGSPADGSLRVGDVSLGVNDQPFANDARVSLAHAIAATEAKTGVLRLICWRDGKTANVELKLPVLGAYSDTAPYDCPKSKAIDKSIRMLRWYVNKGAIPYGDHLPWPGHEDNGKCSLAAVLFDLLGDREATAFFARMGTAGYDERERGHTGNFFNIQWAMLGVSRCGPLATGAYLKEQSWYYDLARNWQGAYRYQGSPVGEEEHMKYTDWDCTGTYLLTYALPLKSLYLTGKQACSVPSLNPKEVEDVIAAGRDYFAADGKHGVTYDGRTTAQLLVGLSSWSPAVRKRSAQTLGKREGDFVPGLLQMLAGADRYGRYGACEALGCLGARADAAAPQLRTLLNDPDPWLESLACRAITRLGPDAGKASENDLLMLAARNNPADPHRMAHRAASVALFAPYPGTRDTSLLRNSLDGVDRRLLYPAMDSILQNEDSIPRGVLAPYLPKLAGRDLAVMLPAIVKAVEIMAPTNEMFADGIRTAGLDLLTSLHLREGMDLCVSTLDFRWGLQWEKRMEYLLRYGSHAKDVLPQLRKKRPDKSPDNAKRFDKHIADIEANADTPKLVSLKDFIARAAVSEDAPKNR